ncbi:MAG: NF038122 family metalloprotease [Planctomycetota bacterium]
MPGDVSDRIDSPLEIEFLFGPSIRTSPEALELVESAANRWRQFIEDPVTVLIEIDLVSDLPDNILGGAISSTMDIDYGTLRQALIDDALIEPDDAITDSLPTPDQLTWNAPLGTLVDPNIELNTASAKALGLLNPNDPDYLLPDATIILNASFFNAVTNPGGAGDGGGDEPDVPDVPPGVDPGDLQSDHFFVPPGRYANEDVQFHGDVSDVQFLTEISDAFEATVVHEIGHALGFRSGIDGVFEGNLTPTVMDLFRFASDVRNFNPASPEEFSTFTRELRSNVEAEIDFVLDAWGTSQVAFPVERGVTGGGFQASHWLDEDLAGTNIGIMDPTGGIGTVSRITLADLRMFDLLGWDIAPPGQTLEQTAPDPRILPQDVNQDGTVSPADALMVINALNVSGGSEAELAENLDVNQDGVTSAIDALLVINHLSRLPIADPPTPNRQGNFDVLDERLLLFSDAAAVDSLF